MKIRTNFVTNSSSYSSTEIKIDNPVLLEILKKYKEKGAFDETRFGYESIGVNAKKAKKEGLLEYNPFLESYEIREELEGYDNKKVALFFYNQENANVNFGPKKIEDVIGCLIKMFDDDYSYSWDGVPESYNELKKELAERAEEINCNYEDVIWKTSNDGYGEAEPAEGEQTEWEFEYHK